MVKMAVYSNDVLVDCIEVEDDYTVEDYREDCTRNGWEWAPCNEDDTIELVKVNY